MSRVGAGLREAAATHRPPKASTSPSPTHNHAECGALCHPLNPLTTSGRPSDPSTSPNFERSPSKPASLHNSPPVAGPLSHPHRPAPVAAAAGAALGMRRPTSQTNSVHNHVLSRYTHHQRPAFRSVHITQPQRRQLRVQGLEGGAPLLVRLAHQACLAVVHVVEGEHEVLACRVAARNIKRQACGIRNGGDPPTCRSSRAASSIRCAARQNCQLQPSLSKWQLRVHGHEHHGRPTRMPVGWLGQAQGSIRAQT